MSLIQFFFQHILYICFMVCCFLGLCQSCPKSLNTFNFSRFQENKDWMCTLFIKASLFQLVWVVQHHCKEQMNVSLSALEKVTFYELLLFTKVIPTLLSWLSPGNSYFNNKLLHLSTYSVIDHATSALYLYSQKMFCAVVIFLGFISVWANSIIYFGECFAFVFRNILLHLELVQSEHIHIAFQGLNFALGVTENYGCTYQHLPIRMCTILPKAFLACLHKHMDFSGIPFLIHSL